MVLPSYFGYDKGKEVVPMSIDISDISLANGRVHISVRTRLFGKFLPSSALKILEVCGLPRRRKGMGLPHAWPFLPWRSCGSNIPAAKTLFHLYSR